MTQRVHGLISSSFLQLVKAIGSYPPHPYSLNAIGSYPPHPYILKAMSRIRAFLNVGSAKCRAKEDLGSVLLIPFFRGLHPQFFRPRTQCTNGLQRVTFTSMVYEICNSNQ